MAHSDEESDRGNLLEDAPLLHQDGGSRSMKLSTSTIGVLSSLALLGIAALGLNAGGRLVGTPQSELKELSNDDLWIVSVAI